MKASVFTKKSGLKRTFSFILWAKTRGGKKGMRRIDMLAQQRVTKRVLPLVVTTVMLSPIVLGSLAYAAGRVFFDDFEDGTTNEWGKDDFRNKCTVVTSATDRIAGPYAGSRMLRCNWNGGVAWNNPASYETLALNTISYSNELFFRIRLRLDENFDRPGYNAVPGKILRIYTTSPSYNDMIEVVYGNGSLSSQCVAGGTSCQTYWGRSDDNTANSSSWHTVEWYFNISSGSIKVWHDGILVRNNSGLSFKNTKWYPFYIGSNYSSPHDAVNHAYFDNIEIYSDNGSGATGAMSDATIKVSGSQPPPDASLSPPNPPQNLVIQ
jgi:hypothetical protein